MLSEAKNLATYSINPIVMRSVGKRGFDSAGWEAPNPTARSYNTFDWWSDFGYPLPPGKVQQNLWVHVCGVSSICLWTILCIFSAALPPVVFSDVIEVYLCSECHGWIHHLGFADTLVVQQTVSYQIGRLCQLKGCYAHLLGGEWD